MEYQQELQRRMFGRLLGDGDQCALIWRLNNSLQKVEPPSQQPGPWDGTVNHTEKGVLGIISQ